MKILISYGRRGGKTLRAKQVLAAMGVQGVRVHIARAREKEREDRARAAYPGDWVKDRYLSFREPDWKAFTVEL